MSFNRRQFIQASIAAAGGAVLAGCSRGYSDMNTTHTAHDADSPGTLPVTRLGRTGRQVSIIGFGGLMIRNYEPSRAQALVDHSIQRGVNYFDVAPTYGDAELKLGPALKPYRDKAFLACKTTERTAEGARKELDASLERLETDHLDLYQLHAIADVEKDVDAVFAKGGAMEAFIEARKAGKIRHIGFSAHSDEAALEAMRRFDFDTILYPVNFACQFAGQFVSSVLQEARRQNIGILCIKSVALRRWTDDDDRSQLPNCWYKPLEDPELIRLAMGWSYDQGSVSLLPPANEAMYRRLLDVAPSVEPLTDSQRTQLAALADTIDPIFKA